MKYIEKMSANENLGWCIPYATEDEKVWAIHCNGKIETIQIDGKTVNLPTEQQIDDLAKKINSDYEYYSGYDATHILIDAMREHGCQDCPFRSACEAVNKDDDEV